MGLDPITTRPDPDELLARVQQQEQRSARGRLKIFFGMAAGVGKTYAMLQAARRLREAGRDVVVGYVEPHGRPETEALLVGLEQLSTREVDYRGARLRELDLDAALSRKPEVLLVDELAHTNAPGSRHAKRWQDVEELLAAGIDVYTTVNVQHVESLNDVVAGITGVPVRETVPDSILAQSDEIELIDLPPDDLLQRLAEGKVYVPEQAKLAAQRFFRKGNLIALREMALRKVAENVDAQMRGYRAEHTVRETWPVAERLMVCIGPSPFAKQLVRAAKRTATQLHADWIVVNVQTPDWGRLPDEVRGRVYEALRLAEQLGAETATLSGDNVTTEVLAFARSRNVSKILIGKPAEPLWKRALRGSILDRLVEQSGEIDVYAVSARVTASEAAPIQSLRSKTPWGQYGVAVLVVAASTLLGLSLHPEIDLADVVMIYLLGIVGVSIRTARGPGLTACLLSAAAFNFFFTTPYYTLAIDRAQFVITFSVMLIVGLTISGLTYRVRSQASFAVERERRTHALFQATRSLSAAGSEAEVLTSAAGHVAETFDAGVAIFLPGEDARVSLRTTLRDSAWVSARELGVAQWVVDNARPGGLGTATLSGAEALQLPIPGAGNRTLGAFAVRPSDARSFHDPERMRLLEAVVAQTGAALERTRLAQVAQQAEVNVETERMRNALLSAVSHDLRTPLATIQGALSGVLERGDRLPADQQKELLETARNEADRLNRLVHNLLDLTRVQSGDMKLNYDWHAPEEIIGAALSQLERRLAGRELTIDIAPDLALIHVDGLLLEQVLVNLLENAQRYSPAGAPIEIKACRSGDSAILEVCDRGPGFAAGEERRVFERFYRAQPNQKGGAGIGLTICDAIVRAHGGTIDAGNRDGGGARLRVSLPLPSDQPRLGMEAQA
ncbi:MAG: sensor histidine kinase KdpD [Bryobacterales bacterium]